MTRSLSGPAANTAGMSYVPQKAKTIWNMLREAKPGKRFKKLHEARRKDPNVAERGQRWRNFVLGLAVVMIGIVLMPAPGPGSLVVLLGFALLASESHQTAELLDRSELKVRRWFGKPADKSDATSEGSAAQSREAVGRPVQQ